MRSLIKFLVLALVIVFIGLWIMTVAKSCDKTKTLETPNLETGIKDKVTEVIDETDSLFNDDEADDEGDFDENGDEILTNDSKTDSDEKDDDEELMYVDDLEEDLEEDNDEDLEEEISAREKEVNQVDPKTSNSARSSSGTEYLIIAGAYLTEANAEREARRLRKKGYDDAEVVTFNFSSYHSVCAERSNSLGDARAIKNRLVKSGSSSAYVHKKRKGKKK